LDLLLNAMVCLPASSLTVVGHDRRAGQWRKRAKALGLGARVRFVGAQAAGPWVAGARLLVHPARYEPYGNVVAEAVAWGVPAVASDRTGAACLLDGAQVWPLAEGPEGLARCIERALGAPAPPVLQPPSAGDHLRALAAALWPEA
jgi:glycosyltransferase involved in cell wall biosynthesis